MKKTDISFRIGEEKDIPLILWFIGELAEYEKLRHEVVATEQLLHEWLFEKQKAEVLIAEDGEVPVAFALFFHNFSTFMGRAGLYLEDLYVVPEYRKKGIGKRILKTLAGLAIERGCGRFEWACLDWNRDSIDFYKAMGACPMDEWTVYRVTGDALQKLAR